MVRNLCSNIKRINKADVYFHGHSSGLLAKPGNKLPVVRINFMTSLLVVFFPFCPCRFQKLLCKNGQENKKWFKFSNSHVGRSSHLTYIKQFSGRTAATATTCYLFSYANSSHTEKCIKEPCIFQIQEHAISCSYFLFKSTENEKEFLTHTHTHTQTFKN